MPAQRPTTRYRQGARDKAARAAHTEQSRGWRHKLADADFPPAERAEFLNLLEQIGNMAAACKRFDIHHSAVYGRMQWDTRFAGDVEKILADNCHGGEVCGRPAGAKRGGCCAACRAAKARGRRPSTSRSRSVKST